jgi:DNA-directed RNA polymerase subunit M/transcription elongation factor TFIIS
MIKCPRCNYEIIRARKEREEGLGCVTCGYFINDAKVNEGIRLVEKLQNQTESNKEQKAS